ARCAARLSRLCGPASIRFRWQETRKWGISLVGELPGLEDGEEPAFAPSKGGDRISDAVPVEGVCDRVVAMHVDDAEGRRLIGRARRRAFRAEGNIHLHVGQPGDLEELVG